MSNQVYLSDLLIKNATAHARNFPVIKSKNMQQTLFKVFDLILGLFAMTITTIEYPLVKMQSDKFSTRSIQSFTAETVYFPFGLGLTLYARLCFEVVALLDGNY